MTSTVNAANGPDFFKWADEMEANIKFAQDYLHPRQKLANMLQNLTQVAPTLGRGDFPKVSLKTADPIGYAARIQKHFEKMGFVFSVNGPKSTYGKVRKFLGLTDLRVWINVVGSQVAIGLEL